MILSRHCKHLLVVVYKLLSRSRLSRGNMCSSKVANDCCNYGDPCTYIYIYIYEKRIVIILVRGIGTGPVMPVCAYMTNT